MDMDYHRTNSSNSVSVVVPDDEQLKDGVRLALRMWDESPVYQHVPRSIDRMVEFAYTARADPMWFLRVAIRNDVCIGFMSGLVRQLAFAEAMIAQEHLFYVTNSSRGTVAAKLLLETFEAWAREWKAVHILLGTSSGVTPERTEHFYNRMGYATVGILTMKGLN